MATDYAAIKADNVIRYGTDIGRIGPMLLADRYDERTHFIFELLQNAEDALRRRESRTGPRSVVFKLRKGSLTVSHFGQPFSRADVAGICGIAEGTKGEDLTAIGRFGIGFKAVYAFTDAPEIHSNDEHFAIDSFVWPRRIPTAETRPNETLFVLPFRASDATAFEEIAKGLQGLGTRTMLFLREIEEISWSVEGGESGTYLREQPRIPKDIVREILLVGQERGSKDVVSESWLVFSRAVQGPDNKFRGFVELAFSLESRGSHDQQAIQRVEDGTLAVFFPTILTTHVGFLIQGPYRTTPSRDNVPRDDPWNVFLVKETASLLVDALLYLKEAGLLTVETLRVLPIDRSKFRADSLFEPIFIATKTALSTRKLLPSFGGTFVASGSARLARTQALRELLSPTQLAQLFGQIDPVFWLSEEITADRAPELRQYLLSELQIGETEPSAIISRLSGTFLEVQTDKWISELYAFLLQQPSLWKSAEFRNVPIVRLENGDQVVAWRDKQPQAFLPSDILTGYPTVRRSICRSTVSRDFLKELGLSEPDPVDDVVVNLLPKYRQSASVGDAEYENDFKRILQAYNTDSKVQREKLLIALRKTPFVAALTLAERKEVRRFVYPERVYLATQRLKDLFANVPNVFLVDDGRECLRGENVRDMLEACGVSRSLLALEVKPAFSHAELTEMRRMHGETGMTYQIAIGDFTISGLTELFELWPTLASDERAKRSALLWDALSELEARRGTSVFWGTYRWFYFKERSHSFAASFVRTLNETRWVPSPEGSFERPADVVFETIAPSWKASSFILSVIEFKPPVLAALAREAGFELGLIDLLMKLGLTKESDLLSRLNMNPSGPTELSSDPAPSTTAVEAIAIEAEPKDPAAAETELDQPRSLTNSEENNRGGASLPRGTPDSRNETVEGPGSDKRLSSARNFISYVAITPLVESDLDGLTHDERTELEEAAIELILRTEPALQRTPTNNPGFDLVEVSGTGRPIRWVEVKAMKQSLGARPVGLSKPQFTLATLREDAYWLYIVERAGDESEARIIRIQDPAGKAQTFTFDKGWLNVAEPAPQ